MTLRLVEDPGHSTQALGHGHGWAVSHLDRSLPPGLRRALLAAARGFSTSAAEPKASLEAIEELRRQLLVQAPLASLAIQRITPSGLRLPRWPDALRLGSPSPATGRLWPFDAELAALLAGLRRLIKRDRLDEAARSRTAARLEGAGLRLRSMRTPDGYTLFAAFEERLLEAAETAERSLSHGGPPGRDAAAWLGNALGYPGCCIRAFLELGSHDDVSLAAGLLPAVPSAPASPLTLWLNGAIAVISHTPCSVECRASAELAGAVLDRLEAEHPGFQELWMALAARVHVVDAAGRSLALRMAVHTRGELRIVEALEIGVPLGAGLPAVAPVGELDGVAVRVEAGGLNAPSLGWQAPFVADHRGSATAPLPMEGAGENPEGVAPWLPQAG